MYLRVRSPALGNDLEEVGLDDEAMHSRTSSDPMSWTT